MYTVIVRRHIGPTVHTRFQKRENAMRLVRVAAGNANVVSCVILPGRK